MKPKFVSGDKVFAKVRGYPYWPAMIVGSIGEIVSKIKYDIIFYGTGEKATVKADDVQPFLEKRHELGRPKKHKAFNDAMAAIDNDLPPEGAMKADRLSEDLASSETSTPVRRKLSVGRPPKTPTNTSLSDSPGTTSKEAKSTKGRKRRSRGDIETGESSAAEATPESTRVGRKIKTKRLSIDSPSPVRNSSVSSAKKKLIDKIEDRCRFDLDGVSVSIALNSNRPPLKCPKNMHNWNRLVTEKACELKEQVINGTISLDQAQQEIDEFTRVKSKEKKKEFEENVQAFKILTIEGKLLQLDVKIKSALTLTKASPADALKHLDELLSLQITSLMLKKHPEIVTSFQKLSRYVGNTARWKMTNEAQTEFSSQAEHVRNKAKQMIEKFELLFEISEGESFSRIFSQQLGEFNRATQKLSQEEFFSLVKEPEPGLE